MLIFSFIWPPFFYLPPPDQLNHEINDSLFGLRRKISGKEKISPRLVHLVMDDATYNSLDVPIWDRSLYGRIIDILTRAGARTIACDLFFRDKGPPELDARLVAAVKNSGNVILPLIFYPETTHLLMSDRILQEESESFSLDSLTGLDGIHALRLPAGSRAALPFEALSRVTGNWGHINIEADEDGVYRRVPLLHQYRDGYIPAMGLRIVLDFYDVPADELQITKKRRLIFPVKTAEGRERTVSIPVDETGAVLLNYPGTWRESFYTYSVRHLLQAENNPALARELEEELEGAIVIISDISSGNKDFGPGIFDKVYPLSGVHLTLANMILTGNYLYAQTILHSLILSLFMAGILWAGIVFFPSRGYWPAVLINIFCLAGNALLAFLVFRTLPLTARSLGGSGLSVLFTGIYLSKASSARIRQESVPGTGKENKNRQPEKVNNHPQRRWLARRSRKLAPGGSASGGDKKKPHRFIE